MEEDNTMIQWIDELQTHGACHRAIGHHSAFCLEIYLPCEHMHTMHAIARIQYIKA